MNTTNLHNGSDCPVTTAEQLHVAESNGSHAAFSRYKITVKPTPILSNPLYAFEARATWEDRGLHGLAKYGPSPEIAEERLQRALDAIDGEIVFDDSTVAPMSQGVIPQGVRLTAITALLLHIALGMFFSVLIIAPDCLEVAARYWGIK